MSSCPSLSLSLLLCASENVQPCLNSYQSLKTSCTLCHPPPPIYSPSPSYSDYTKLPTLRPFFCILAHYFLYSTLHFLFFFLFLWVFTPKMVSFRRIQDAHFVKLGLFYLGFETQQALVILSHEFAPNWYFPSSFSFYSKFYVDGKFNLEGNF